MSIINLRILCNKCGAEFLLEVDTEEFDSEDQERLRKGEPVVIENVYCFSCQASIDWEVTRGWAYR